MPFIYFKKLANLPGKVSDNRHWLPSGFHMKAVFRAMFASRLQVVGDAADRAVKAGKTRSG